MSSPFSGDIFFPQQKLVRQAEHDVTLAAARTILALKMYKMEHGAYPEELAELVPAHLETLPVDAFTGDPLVYRVDERCLVLYSAGENGQDDQGLSSGADDADSEQQPDDIAWCIDLEKGLKRTQPEAEDLRTEPASEAARE